ncbi:hypothetical protein LSUCC1028_03860 [Rhodobacterales bacterium LSUCC1028]|nr:hypothetical protein [Rhodobacterales bacterium LSUCC1028]
MGYDQFLYLFVYAIACFIICGKRRNFDFFSIIFLSSSYYALPLIGGKIYDPNDHLLVELPSEIYLAYGAFFVLLASFALYLDAKGHQLTLPSEAVLRSYSKSLLIVTSLLFIIILILSPRGLLPVNIDANSASELGVIWVLYRIMAISFFTCVLFANSKISLLAMFFIFTTLTSGSRTYFVLAILIYVLWRYYGEKIRIATKPTFVIGVPLGVMLLTIFKAIYQYLLILDFESLLDFDKMISVIIFKTFGGSEAIVTLSFVRGIEVWKDGIDYDFYNIFVTSIPLLTEIITSAFNLKAQAFSEFLEPLFFYDVGYGVGSNLWGSMYATGGIIATLLCMYLYLLSFYAFILHSKAKQASTGFIFPIMTLLAFYATRWELAAIIYVICAAYFCYLVIQAYRLLLHRKSRIKKCEARE